MRQDIQLKSLHRYRRHCQVATSIDARTAWRLSIDSISEISRITWPLDTAPCRGWGRSVIVLGIVFTMIEGRGQATHAATWHSACVCTTLLTIGPNQVNRLHRRSPHASGSQRPGQRIPAALPISLAVCSDCCPLMQYCLRAL